MPGSTTRTARRRPIRDLVAPGRFLLIAGEDGDAWCDAARELAAEAGLPLDARAHRPHRRRPLRPALHVAAPSRRSSLTERSSFAPTASSHGASRGASEAPLERARRRAGQDPRPTVARRRPAGLRPWSREVDVAIVGYGPVGQALAALLGRAGHRVAAFERFSRDLRLPRAVHIDHEIMRLLQALGLADASPAR